MVTQGGLKGINRSFTSHITRASLELETKGLETLDRLMLSLKLVPLPLHIFLHVYMLLHYRLLELLKLFTKPLVLLFLRFQQRLTVGRQHYAAWQDIRVALL